MTDDILMKEIIPAEPFSFQEWRRGYVFEPLNEISTTRFNSQFSLVDSKETYVINVIYTKQTQILTKDPIKVECEIFRYNGRGLGPPLADIPSFLQEGILKKVQNYLGSNERMAEFRKFASEFDEIKDFKDMMPSYRLASVLMTEWMPIFAYLSTNTTVKMYHSFLKEFKSLWGLEVPRNAEKQLSLPPLGFMVGLTDNDYRKTKVGFRARFLPEMVLKFAEESSSWKNASDDYEKALKTLMSVKGIGDYSARTTLLYGLRMYHIGFVDSFVKTLMNTYFGVDKSTTNTKLLKYIDSRFSPFQGLLIDWLTGIHQIKEESKNY